jgi:predicted transcriptional regulator
MDYALPMQVRLAVVSLRDESHTYDEIASLLGIGRASVSRLLRRRRETGQLERSPRGGGLVSPIHGRIVLQREHPVKESEGPRCHCTWCVGRTSLPHL